MNPTTTGGATPSSDGGEPGGEVETVDSRPASSDDVLPPLPAPRAARPLPRRAPGATEPLVVPGQESSRDPDGRPFDAVDETTLNRLLSGLRDI